VVQLGGHRLALCEEWRLLEGLIDTHAWLLVIVCISLLCCLWRVIPVPLRWLGTYATIACGVSQTWLDKIAMLVS